MHHIDLHAPGIVTASKRQFGNVAIKSVLRRTTDHPLPEGYRLACPSERSVVAIRLNNTSTPAFELCGNLLMRMLITLAVDKCLAAWVAI
jgi:hypothetical protein